MPLVLDEVTYSGMNEGAVREEGTPREVISEVRLQEKNDMVRWWGNDLWEGSPIVSLPPAPVLNTCMDLVNVLIVEEVLEEWRCDIIADYAPYAIELLVSLSRDAILSLFVESDSAGVVTVRGHISLVG
ncbi:hypothetical protein V6N11_010461 [Hibiscus sabdariffa]|uniref:Uncharacterized protein n=1 Tax=Hibiscus sabdariffa TaxID=183260 RepID=A0ABR2S684_9ROSI